MKLQANHVWFFFVLVLFSFVPHSSGSCTYRIQVVTGDVSHAGTDAKVSLALCPEPDSCILNVPNLAQYGTQGPNHDYFERGDRDNFVVPSKNGCVDTCRMIISHDNTGSYPGWYVASVRIEAYENNVVKEFDRHFTVNQWLALDEKPPTLVVELNHCPIRKVAASDDLGSSLLKQHVTA